MSERPSKPTFPPLETDGADARTIWLLKYQPWLQLLARSEIDSRFRGKFSASDAVQQTLLEAWKDWERFRGDDEPQRRAWLRQILAHQLAHLARHYAGTRKRDVSRELSLQQSLAASAGRLEALLPSADSSPSVRAMRREDQARLADVLEKLPADYRQVIVLRHLQDLSHAEIAQQMNRSEGAVRMLWVRALAALRAQLESDTGGE
jgi:RNA polymerase sigma-70 factor (ECF subfamily)